MAVMTVGPAYHSVRGETVVTLSPARALTGMTVTREKSRRAAAPATASASSENRAWSKPTASSLFTAMITWCTPMSAQMVRCR